ncbi:hypothetical protein BGZ46_000848 [Entomortierella lignicola]|nr:hypothetical protein BGZ46_000848 [Entomortierella lignicola]
MEDIRDVFPHAVRFKLNGDPIPFLRDTHGKRFEPLRIDFYPSDILEVLTDPPPSTITKAVIHSLTRGKSDIQFSQDLLSSSSALLQSYNSSHNAGELEKADIIKSGLVQKLGAIEMHMAVSNENSQEMKEMQMKITNLLQETKENNEKMMALQLEAKENNDKMMALQLEAKEKDDKMALMQNKMLDLQHQALDRLVILQKHANAILVQNFELHEYPIPRLFIILPVDKSKWDPTRILENKFRLHFLCECGDHTIESSKSSENQIHLAKHKGYEIKDGVEFFKKYGKYMLILMRALKLGMHSANISMPHIPVTKLVDVGIDYSISYMEVLSNDNPVLDSTNTIDDYEGLEGADLRQLDTFLRTNDQGRKLGNLYRIATESVNGGKYDEELGRVVISLGSRIRAQEFFHALAKARHVYDLDVKFDWDCSTSDVEALEKALKVSNVSILRLDLRYFQASLARKLSPVSTHYEKISRIIQNRNMKVIHIVLSKDFIKLPSLEPRKSSNFQKLSIEMISQSLGASDFRFLVNSLKTNTSLTTLNLGSNSIGQEGALALSEALKTNTTLTTLDLRSNSISQEGALALSEALKTNTSLTTLNLGSNSIGQEGVLALSEALKINTTLTTLGLWRNSIRGEGALALSEALKINTTLTTLNLLWNSIGQEGALALSEALKTSTTLTTLNLGSNSIGKEGTLALSEALKTNTSLTTLNLGSNSIGQEGALALSEALKTNTTLTTLDLRSNSISQEGALALSEALKTNTTLTTLNLWSNLIGKEGALALSEASKTNDNLRIIK